MTLTLATASPARIAILRGGGLAFDAVGSGVNEDPIKRDLLKGGASPAAVARALAAEKALAVSRLRPGLVIGADQTLDLDGRLFDKAGSLAEARERLTALRDRTHRLHSAVAVAQEGEVVWRTLDSAVLTARPYTDAFLDAYLERNGEAVLGSVGCYMLEGEGVQLFERIEGDYFTILGLPMLPLLAYLRERGILAA
jgi:septum formation protein